MRPTPAGWPRLSTSLYYDDAPQAIDWLCTAFGFELRLKVEGAGGSIEHSELTYGDAVVMVSQSGAKPNLPRLPRSASPASLNGANTQRVMLYVDDAQAHYQQALAAGARIVDEPRIHDYGEDYWADRIYCVLDLEGHVWWISERVREPQG